MYVVELVDVCVQVGEGLVRDDKYLVELFEVHANFVHPVHIAGRKWKVCYK